jgi:outer membrane protein OmpA-like peptidoglycan-associated protein
MTTNIVEMVTSSLSPEQIDRSASTINVPSERVRSVMPGVVAAVLGALMHRMSAPHGQAALTDAVSAYSSTGANRNGMLERLFGDKLGPMTDVVAGHAGVSRAAGGSLLAIASAAVVGVLGKLVMSHRLGEGGLRDYLATHHGAIMAAAPAGLATALGLRTLAQLKHVPPTVTVVSAPQTVVHPRRSGLGALLAALAALGILALAAFVLTRRVRTPELPTITGVNIPAPKINAPTIPQITPPAVPAMPAIPAVPAPEMPKVENPIDAAIGGAGALPAKLPIGNIEFPFASATPTAESMPAIDALAASLKAHDGARVRLDGYTDSVGDDDVNRPLSWQRAESVRTLLRDRGVGADRMMSVGHSEKRPIGDNGTAPGRAENRRVEATLLAR